MQKTHNLSYHLKKTAIMAMTVTTVVGTSVPSTMVAVYADEASVAQQTEAQASFEKIDVNFTGGDESYRVAYGDYIKGSDFKVMLKNGEDETEVKNFYALPGMGTDEFSELSDSVRLDKEQLEKLDGVNSFQIPTQEELSGNSYPVTVVFYSTTCSEEVDNFGQTEDGLYCYAAETTLSIQASQTGAWLSYTDEYGITWNFKTREGDTGIFNLNTADSNAVALVLADGTLQVPELIDGVEVISIGGGTKERPFVPKNLNFSQISFPASVKEIESYAFYKSHSDARVDIPKTVKTIHSFAGYGAGFKSVTIATDGTVIEKGAFANEKNLSAVYVTGTAEIGEIAFAECSGLNKLVLTGDITIGENAFYNDKNMTTANVANMSGVIGVNAFKNCSSLTSLYIPNKIVLSEDSFYGCTGLKVLEVNAENIPNNSFRGCANLNQVVFGNRVSSVDYAWGGFSDEIRTQANEEKVATDIYVKNNDTCFGVYSDGNEYFSAFMGHSSAGNVYNNYRDVTVHMSDEEALSFIDTSDGSAVRFSASPVVYSKDTSLYETYYNANGAINVTFEGMKSDVSGNTIYPENARPVTVRDGIDAFYNGVVLATDYIVKENIVVYPTYADGTPSTGRITDFLFYNEAQLKDSIRAWLSDSSAGEDEEGYSGFCYRDVTGYDKSASEHAYAWYAKRYAEGNLSSEQFEQEKKVMEKAVFENKELLMTAGNFENRIDDTTTVWDSTTGQAEGVQTLTVIYYPEGTEDYHVTEPDYYTTTVDVKIIGNGTVSSNNAEIENEFHPIMEQIEILKEKTQTALADYLSTKEQLKVIKATENTVELKEKILNLNKQLAEQLKYLKELTKTYNDLVERLSYFDSHNNADNLGRNGANEKTGEGYIYIDARCYTYGLEDGYTKLTADNHEVIMHKALGDPLKNGSESFEFYLMLDGIHVLDGSSEVVFDKTLKDYIEDAMEVLTSAGDDILAMQENYDETKESVNEYIRSLQEQGIDVKEDIETDDILTEIREQVKNLVVEYSEVKEDYVGAIGAIYNEKSSISDLDAEEFEEVLEALTNLKTSADALAEKIEQALEAEDLTEDEIKSLNELLTRVRIISDALGSDIPLIQNIMAALDVDDPDKVLDAIKELHKQLKELTESSSALSRRNLYLENQIADLNEKLAALEAKLDELEEKNSELAEENEKLTIQVGTLSGNAASSEKELELVRQVADLQSEINSLSKQKKESDNKVVSLTSQIKALETKVATLTATNDSMDDEITDLKKNNTKLTSQITTLKNQITSLNNKITSLTTQNTNLQQQLADAKKTGSATSSTVKRASSSSTGTGTVIKDSQSSSSSSKAAVVIKDPVTTVMTPTATDTNNPSVVVDNGNKNPDTSTFNFDDTDDTAADDATSTEELEMSENDTEIVEEESNSMMPVIVIILVLALIGGGVAAVYIVNKKVLNKPKTDDFFDDDELLTDEAFLEEPDDEYTDEPETDSNSEEVEVKIEL